MLLEFWPMSHKGIRSSAVYAGSGSVSQKASGVVALTVGIAFLIVIAPRATLAQHHGGGGGHGMGTGVGTGGGRPDGISEKDDLKDFHRAIAVQANAEQRAAFAKVAQYTQSACDQLRAFQQSLQKAPPDSPLSERATALDQAIERTRAGSQNFLTSLSSVQKSGLKDATNKLAKADSELVKQAKLLEQNIQIPKPDGAQIASSAAALDKELTGFQNEQLALGREMGILLSDSGQELAFNLSPVTNSIDVAGHVVAIPASGVVSRTSVENGNNIFDVKLVDDLSDVQQNITDIVRARLTRAPGCGERIEILQATIMPQAPSSVVVARLHYERWVCAPGRGPQSATEVAAGDGTIEVKLTPSIEANIGFHLAPETVRAEADGFLREMLRSGDLGLTLREEIAASLVSVLQKSTDVKSALPPAGQAQGTIRKAQFQNAGADQLALVLDGQLQLSAEQTTQFAAQLKQRLAAQGP
jgi:hypothetical protein